MTNKRPNLELWFFILTFTIVVLAFASVAIVKAEETTSPIDQFKFQVGWESGKAWTMGFFSANDGPQSVLKNCKSKEEYYERYMALETKQAIASCKAEALDLIWNWYQRGVLDGITLFIEKANKPKEAPKVPI